MLLIDMASAAIEGFIVSPQKVNTPIAIGIKMMLYRNAKSKLIWIL